MCTFCRDIDIAQKIVAFKINDEKCKTNCEKECSDWHGLLKELGIIRQVTELWVISFLRILRIHFGWFFCFFFNRQPNDFFKAINTEKLREHILVNDLKMISYCHGLKQDIRISVGFAERGADLNAIHLSKQTTAKTQIDAWVL